jgi:hypothetical protein
LSTLNLLKNIEFEPDAEKISSRLHLGEMTGALSLEDMLNEAASIGGLRAAWALFEPVAGGDDKVEFGSELLTSRVLRVNLEESESAALFVATCGVELERWCDSFDDPLERWVADAVCEDALRCANDALETALEEVFTGKFRVSMNPGSLEDWPLAEQGPLFRALGKAGDITAATGVELTDSFLMRPRKSISGVRFASSRPFTNCMLCPRENCRGRRMRYDPAQFEQLYAGASRGSLYADTCGCGHDAAR